MAVCDLDEAKARNRANEFGVPRVYADWREMIDRARPDFVDVITPPASHQEICAFAAARAIDIVCQKPPLPHAGGERGDR